jgi:hypothetical protein
MSSQLNQFANMAHKPFLQGLYIITDWFDKELSYSFFIINPSRVLSIF